MRPMSAKKPSLVNSLDFPSGQAVSFDVEAFDDLIQSQGVKLIHFRAMRCPVGLVDRYDNRRPEHDHSGCSNGFIYTKAGELTASFMGSGASVETLDTATVDGSSVQVTCQRFYDGTEEPVHIAPFDRLYLAEEGIVVPTWQLFESHITGKEKLQFPVNYVQDLMDNEGKRYIEGTDFKVEGGYIVWTGSNRPRFDAVRQKGAICAIRYLYRPYYYVQRLLHQVRVTQAEDKISGERVVQRMPQAMVLVREFVFEKEDKDPQAPESESLRQVPGPRDGSFGPR